jgi:hypothetical protein
MLALPIQTAFGGSNNISITNFEPPKERSIGIDVVDLINQVDELTAYDYLEPLLSLGPRPTGSKNCKDAAEYIYGEFQKLGLDTYIDQWRYPRYKCRNVIATLNGSDPSSDAIFLLCAHMDSSENSPGANDDGSGIAALLTIANICSKYTFNHTIRFVATSGEEVGLYGSNDYAKKIYAKNENVVAVLNMDTFGNTTDKGGDVVYLLKPDRSDWISTLIKEIAQTYYEHINLQVLPIGNRANDHQSFLSYGYDALQFVQLARGNYPLHTPKDSIEKVNFTYLVKVIKLILATTTILADKPIELQVIFITPREGQHYLFNIPILKQFRINFGGKNTRGLTYIHGRTTARIKITTNEEINSISYTIDGHASFSGFIQESPYNWTIKISAKKLPSIGRHTLGVYVSTTNGKIAYDEMDIFVLTFY